MNAFSTDADNSAALHPRLRQFLVVAEPEGSERQELAEMAILPVKGQMLAPSAVAFTGQQG